EQRYDIYDLFLRFPEPLVPRSRRLEVAERLDRDGRVVTPLDLDGVRAAVRRLVDEGVDALALCFLHSYANPAHEQVAGELIRREFPGLPVSLSSEVVAELREYPRAVTTCANAYVQPLMDRYVANLERSLAARGFRGALRLMHSARVHRFKPGSGLPIKAPVLDMIEIGAGGGSIAAVDEVGLLRVGPRSAGADPGPACYGRGGAEATVTDANLALGFYDPHFFLGGRMTLDRNAAMEVLAKLGEKIGLSPLEAAHGIHEIVTENMAAAARIHLVEKGKDPRNYAIVGFGGAGPAHAAGVARALGVREVIVPPASGAASALGFLTAPLSFESARSSIIEFRLGFDAQRLNGLLDTLETE